MLFVRRSVVVVLVAAAGSALFAGAASARVQTLVPQQSIRGVKIGMIQSQVRAVLGKPSSNRTISHPILGKARTMRFGLIVVLFRGASSTASVINISTTSKRERTARGVGVGSTEEQLAARLSGERCVTEFGYRHCYLGKWNAGFLVTDFSISKSGRVTRIMLGLVID